MDRNSDLRFLILWITTDCNLRCRYCYARGGENPRYMEWEVARQALDFMAESGSPFKIQFAGGEPLLYLDFIQQIVDYTSSWPVRYQLQTNATLIDAPTARYLHRMGIDVGVSLDGLPAINDVLRPFADGSGSTDAALAGIKELGAIGIRAGLTTVITQENLQNLPELVTLASYLGNIEGISLDMLRPVGRALEEGTIAGDPDTAGRCVSEALQRADIIASLGGRRVVFREVERMRALISSNRVRKYRCYFDAGQSLMVKPDGSAWPCASLADFSEFSLGNVLDTSFKAQIGQRLVKGQKLCLTPEECLGCPDLELCGGPCPAQVYTQKIAGQISRTECGVRTAFMNYARSKGTTNHETKTTCVSV